jgi:hypothetical protein
MLSICLCAEWPASTSHGPQRGACGGAGCTVRPAALRQAGQRLEVPRLTINTGKEKNTTSLSRPASFVKLRALRGLLAACAGLVCSESQAGMPAMPDGFNTAHLMSSFQIKRSIPFGVASTDWFVGV